MSRFKFFLYRCIYEVFKIHTKSTSNSQKDEILLYKKSPFVRYISGAKNLITYNNLYRQPIFIYQL
jgi:hypothetical protein